MRAFSGEKVKCFDKDHHHAVGERYDGQCPTPPDRYAAAGNFFAYKVSVGYGGFVIGVAAVCGCLDVFFVVFFVY